MAARQVRVTGRVQGVAFRAWTQKSAEELGVRGWVRNCTDGSVEAHLEGDEDLLDELIARMRHGPPFAHVDELTFKTIRTEGLEGFHLRG
ncbi:MAG TPA: acylphosphatase [Sphingomicrobium sp.]|nr:acylphosphatase [Sphingomicrobium sp.]